VSWSLATGRSTLSVSSRGHTSNKAARVHSGMLLRRYSFTRSPLDAGTLWYLRPLIVDQLQQPLTSFGADR
jgi:hypothetical protein